jgi:molybdopterin molybdotransferase
LTEPKRSPLLPLDDALARLLAVAAPLPGAESVAVGDADGRVLAQDVVSALHVPPQDNSSMDGYAVCCADLGAPGVLLPVSQRIPAGASGAPLQSGTVARIFTGAPVPQGADAIVMQEDCTVVEGGQHAQGSDQHAANTGAIHPPCRGRRGPWRCGAGQRTTPGAGRTGSGRQRWSWRRWTWPADRAWRCFPPEMSW